MSILLLLALVIVGWAAGWMVNLLADSLPVIRRISRPACSRCGFHIPWPSYLMMEACPTCKGRRSVRSWILQLGFPAFFLLIGVMPPERLTPLEALLLVSFFGIVAVIDIEHHLVLHPVSIVGALIGLVVGVRLHGLAMTLIGGAAGFGIMLALFYLGELFAKLLSRMRGQPVEEVALGFGDVNLAGVLGLVLGWPGITACLFIAILIGGLISGIYLIIMVITRSYRAFTAVPYAPFLLLSAVFLLFRP